MQKWYFKSWWYKFEALINAYFYLVNTSLVSKFKKLNFILLLMLKDILVLVVKKVDEVFFNIKINKIAILLKL